MARSPGPAGIGYRRATPRPAGVMGESPSVDEGARAPRRTMDCEPYNTFLARIYFLYPFLTGRKGDKLTWQPA